MPADRVVKKTEFPTNYELLDEGVEDLPRLAPLSPDGVAVGVRMDGREFALVLPAGRGECGSGVMVAATPDPDSLFVAALGEAYLVSLTDPIRVKNLDCYAATACAAFPQANALVVVDFRNVLCLGPHGVAWTSSDLSDDAIRFVGQTDRSLLLRTYSAADDEWTTRAYPVPLDAPI